MCLEYALRERFGDEITTKYWNKKNYGPTLKPLLSFAKDFGYIRNEGFTIWHEVVEKRAKHRHWMEKLEEMKNSGLDKSKIDYSEVRISERDKDYDYVKILCEVIPTLRNNYAHGSSTLHNQVLGSFHIVKDILDQIY